MSFNKQNNVKNKVKTTNYFKLFIIIIFLKIKILKASKNIVYIKVLKRNL